MLVEVTGLDLDREGIIKMPLNLEPRAGTDWRDTLRVALDRLNQIDAEASPFRAESGRYIRPILLAQAERTGTEQRDGAHIHALDVKDWLRAAVLDEAEIAIKTADTNDLAQPENLDLLSPTNRVRAIVTKQALQEGWDCPFAYVLCSLAARRRATGRQPRHRIQKGRHATDDRDVRGRLRSPGWRTRACRRRWNARGMRSDS